VTTQPASSSNVQYEGRSHEEGLLAAAALVALPVVAQAQTLQYPGFYAGLEGGVNWMLNTTILNQSVSPQTGFAVGGVVGYDFVGPRVEAEVVYRNNQNNVSFGGTAINNQINQLGVLANVLYDFNAGGTIVPYIGAGAGIAFVDGNNSFGSTQFAYQGIIGVGYNITDTFRVNLDGRYYGTTNPQVSGNGFNNNNNFTSSWNNNNFSIMLGLQVKFGAPPVVVAPPPPPVTQAPSYMVFFDWDRSNLSAQALPRSARLPTPTRPRVTPASRRPAIPTRRARKPTTWRCRCVVPTRSRTRWCATACRRRRSPLSAAASRACWSRPPTVCASRRTAASRSSSSKTTRNIKI